MAEANGMLSDFLNWFRRAKKVTPNLTKLLTSDMPQAEEGRAEKVHARERTLALVAKFLTEYRSYLSILQMPGCHKPLFHQHPLSRLVHHLQVSFLSHLYME